MKGTVYIVNYAGQFDFTPAQEFGKLKAITKGSVHIFAPSRLAVEVREKMKDFNAEKDFLLFCGSTVINVLAVLEALRKAPYVKVLIYGTRDGKYVPITINQEWDKELEDVVAEKVANSLPPPEKDSRQPSLFHHTLNGKDK
jgi:hypothetical protein